MLAVALHSGVSLITTFNLKDFPATILEPMGVQAIHPDDFALDRIADGIEPVLAALRAQAAALTRPPTTVHDVLARLQECGLPRTVARLRAEMGQ